MYSKHITGHVSQQTTSQKPAASTIATCIQSHQQMHQFRRTMQHHKNVNSKQPASKQDSTLQTVTTPGATQLDEENITSGPSAHQPASEPASQQKCIMHTAVSKAGKGDKQHLFVSSPRRTCRCSCTGAIEFLQAQPATEYQSTSQATLSAIAGTHTAGPVTQDAARCRPAERVHTGFTARERIASAHRRVVSLRTDRQTGHEATLVASCNMARNAQRQNRQATTSHATHSGRKAFRTLPPAIDRNTTGTPTG